MRCASVWRRKGFGSWDDLHGVNVTAFLRPGALKKGSRHMQERFKEWPGEAALRNATLLNPRDHAGTNCSSRSPSFSRNHSSFSFRRRIS